MSARWRCRPPPSGSNSARACRRWIDRPWRWRWSRASSNARARRCLPRCARWPCRPEPIARSALDLRQQVVLLAQPRDQRELGLDPVDVLFLGHEDVDEELAADVVADRFAMRDRRAQQRQRVQLEAEIAFKQFARVLADA